MVAPSQTGLLLAATEVVGVPFTITVVLASGLIQPFTVARTAYTPVLAVVAFGIEGFCINEINPVGPVQV